MNSPMNSPQPPTHRPDNTLPGPRPVRMCRECGVVMADEGDAWMCTADTHHVLAKGPDYRQPQ